MNATGPCTASSPNELQRLCFDAMSDHEKLSMPLLEGDKAGRARALLTLKLLAGRSSREVYAGKQSAEGGGYDS